jgi:hypothetical protein
VGVTARNQPPNRAFNSMGSLFAFYKSDKSSLYCTMAEIKEILRPNDVEAPREDDVDMCALVEIDRLGEVEVKFFPYGDLDVERLSPVKEEIYRVTSSSSGELEYTLRGARVFEEFGIDVGKHYTDSGSDASSERSTPRKKKRVVVRPETPFMNQYPVDIGHGVLAFSPPPFQPPAQSVLRQVMLRQRSYGRDFVPPPRVTYFGASPIIRHDVSFGAKFIPENMCVQNRAVFGALSHMSVAEMLPFIYMVNRSERACASDYWDRLAAYFPKFRIRNVFKNLYRFVYSAGDMRALAEDSDAFPQSLAVIAYAEQYILDYKEKNQAKVTHPFRRVEFLNVAAEFQPPTFEEVSSREFDLEAYLDIHAHCEDSSHCVVSEQASGYEDIYDLLSSPIPVLDLQGRKRNSGNPYTSREGDRYILNSEIKDQKNILRQYGLKMLDSLVHLHAISRFVASREWGAALGQIYLMMRDRLGVLDRAKGLYNAWADLSQMREWKGELDDIFSELEDLEEEDVEGEVETILGRGAADFVGSFGKSTVWRKLMALVSALSAPEILYKLPGFASSAITAFAGGVFTVTSSSNLTQACLGFFSTFLDRLKVAWEEKSFWAFLREGGYETFLIRGADLSVANVKGPGAYVSISSLLEDLDAFVREGQRYVAEDACRSPSNWKMKPEHHRILQQIVVKRANWEKRMHAMAGRKKEPMSAGFAGPPGIGKTTLIQELGLFIVRHTPGRIPGPDGKIQMDAGDIYNVPTRDKHWNNCTNPRLLNFNDLPGTGYVNNGTMINMADLLRLAVDTEPFYTPQADLDSKADNVIDPEMATFTTNDMMFKFGVFGNNWEKLLRRYPNLYYIAYPSRFYSTDINPIGEDHGVLIDPEMKIKPEFAHEMRVYRMKATHLTGDIRFNRTALLEGGVRAMMLEIKSKYLEHRGIISYSLTNEKRCSNLTHWDDHNSPCMQGCDWSPPVVEVEEIHGGGFSCCRKQMDVMADKQFDRILQMYKSKAYAKYLEAKEFVKEYLVELSLGLGALLVLWEVKKTVVSIIPKKKIVEDVWPSDLRPVSAMTIEGNVINPMTHETPASYAVRFGLREAEAREMANPPTYPSNSRQHIFLSPASATADSEDVRRLIRSNSHVFKSKEHTGVGVFVDSTTLLMNTHVWKDFGGQVSIVLEKDNGMKFFSDLSVAVHDGDLTLIRVPSYPAANVWKHIPTVVGRTCDISVGSADWEPAVRKLISFGHHLGGLTTECWTYKTAGVAGDCGTPGVGRINGKGLWLSYHVALLANGEGAGFCMGPHVKILASRLPPSPGQVVVRPFVDEVSLLHAQSKLRAARGVSMAIVGTFESGKKNAKSRLIKTEYNELVCQEMVEKKTIPQLQVDGVMVDGEWRAPYVHKWKGMAYEPVGMNRPEVLLALRDYLTNRPTSPLHPLTLAQAIRGVIGDPMLKSMNFSTSAGSLQRFYGGKKYVLDADHIASELHSAYWTYVDLLVDNVVAEHQKWCLKDELVTFLKEATKKYRYFMVSDLPNLLAFRMFVAPLVAHMYRNKEFFEAYGAFNPASPDYGVMMDRLRKFSLLLMADIKHMDSSHRAMLAEAVAEIFVQVALDGGGYNNEALKVVRNLVVGVVFSLVELNGDLSFVNEGMGSGVYVTFIFNCLVLSIMYRVAWSRVSKDLFRSHNVLVCGGDDSTATTDNPLFTGVHVQRVFAEFGYELTPPTAKDGLMVDFFPFSEMVFLKRRPSYCFVHGRKVEVGALEPDSIWRSIGWTNSDVAVSQGDRMMQVLDAAQREFALHGVEAFERFHRLIGPSARFRRLTYDEVMERYVANKLYEDIEQYEIESCLVQRVYGHSKENKDQPLMLEHYVLWGDEQVREAASEEKGDTVQAKGVFTPALRFAHVPFPNWKAKLGNAKAQIHSANFIGNDTEVTTQEQVVTFEMASATSSVVAPTPHEAKYALPSGEVAIQDALKRPVYLGTISWTTATAAVNTFGSIYDLWRVDSMVDSKLFGYKFWRGKPVLRFVVNGMSTSYGKLVLAVDLNPGEDGNCLYNGLDPKINSWSMGNVCQALQTDHISVDPSESCTYDYPIPWYSATGWYNRFDATLTPVVTLKYFVCNALDSVSAVAATPVTIQVYLMMEDLELSVPAVAAILGKKKATKTVGGVTSNVAPLEAQPNGTASKALSAMAGASGMLSTIPALTPFLGPFSVGLGMASKVASTLGYSAPRALEEKYEVLNRVVSPAQYTDGRQGITVLAGDPKQSVAFTAEAAGVGDDDDMLIAKVVRKFGLLERVSWSPANAAAFALLTLPVSPYDQFTVTAPYVQYTPLSFVSNAFRYWSGSVVYRIEIVVSGFHRGAIGVSWIPYDDPPGGSVLNYPNRYLTKVIDITETKVVDMIIPYAGDTIFSAPGTANGALRFYVINPLVTTGSIASVGINVYHAAGEDFELYRPNTSGIASITPIPVAAVQSSKKPADEAEPKSGASDVVVSTPNLKMLSFGEGFTSLKQLANRYCVVSTERADSFTAKYLANLAWPLEGMPPKITSNGRFLNDFSTYFSYAFLSMRGGKRWKYSVAPYSTAAGLAIPDSVGKIQAWIGARHDTAGAYPVAMQVRGDIIGSTGEVFCENRYGNGVHLDSLNLHPYLEFETPYIGMCQFTNPRKPFAKDYGNFGSTGECINVSFYAGACTSTIGQLFQAAGDDFSLHGFFFVPEMRPITNT